MLPSVREGLNQAGGGGTAADIGMTTVQISSVDLNAAVEKAIPVILRKGGAASRALRGSS